MACFAALTVVRLILTVLVAAAAVLAPGALHDPGPDLFVASAAFAGLAVVAEATRRLTERRALRVMSGLLLVDGVYLAFVTATTGGAGSPLTFLVYMHVVAATLVLTHRTGLKVAVWYVEAGRNVAQEVKGDAVDRAQQVKEHAADAASTVGDSAKQQAAATKDQATAKPRA